MAKRSAMYLREKHGSTDMTPWTPVVL
jgi:hypothetical protein